MNANDRCPRCNRPLGNDSLEGLCPECMLKAGLVTEPIPDSETTPPPEPGDVLGRYRIQRRLGAGGMGVVYEAEETDSGRRVALKILRQQLDSPQDRARFLREGRMAASINHPNCVYVFGTEELDGTPAISMEFIGGTTLGERLERDGPLPVADAVDAMLQVIDGLEAAQAAGILHRDIKPSNCFEDSDGRIKIGDFGLSISTLPRAETLITEEGTMVGTPVFCSPEQLRGEDLDARSDMYAVGVTLFQLLTGRFPFEGKTMPQLIANALESRPPSPQQFRREIPAGLARAVLRCLEKQPSGRFRSYADLRKALAPYSSDAPRPATLGLRFVAGCVDTLLLSLIGQVASILAFGDMFTMLERMMADPARAWVMVLPWFAISIAYFALCEWRWGATAGKALCRLRVVRPDRAYPRLGQALIRAVCYHIIPVLPYGTVAAFNAETVVYPGAANYILSTAYYVLLASLFVTARRRNGFASAYDLLTHTRIVSRTALASRSQQPAVVEVPVDEASDRQIGPYHVLGTLEATDKATWFEGYDLRLLRRVLIRTVPPGTPPLPAPIRSLSRVGRLRWLAGRRGEGESWDAFEGVGGQPLSRAAAEPQPWSRVRFWLADLAEELQTAAPNDAPAPVLALDRVWITDAGRAKLFDVPAPGGQEGSEALPSAQAFLTRVTTIALSGWEGRDQTDPDIRRPMPLHAREFLGRLPGLVDPTSILNELRPLLSRTAAITRLRRFAVIAGCLCFPLFATGGAVFGASMMRNWQEDHPGLLELSQLLQTWKAKDMPFMKEDALPPDRLFGIYIATHYGEVIQDEVAWAGPLAHSLISGKARTFAEESLVAYSMVSEDDRAAAETAIDPIVSQQKKWNMPNAPRLVLIVFTVTLLTYVGLPAVLAALLFRGGLVLRVAGVTFVRRDGLRASRLRLLWRAMVAWGPVAFLTGFSFAQAEQSDPWLAAAGILALCALVGISLWMPKRGLPDRLSGTWPLPR